MILPFELGVGVRYIRAKRHNHFISFISMISMAGIVLGVAALIVVLSVMNGFQTELRNRILSVVSHIEVEGIRGPLDDWPRVLELVRRYSEVKGVAPFVNGQGLLNADGEVLPSLIRGVDPELEPNVSEIHQRMVKGKLTDLKSGEWGVALGVGLARRLRVDVGDSVTVIVPQGQVTIAGFVPRHRLFRVVGIFEAGQNEYDNQLAVVHLADAQRLMRLGEAISGLRIKTADLFDAPRVARGLWTTLPVQAQIRDWTMGHANLFRAVQMEKRVMFIILTLIVAVAAFNIVSTLVMLVTDKRADIAILRTLGASPGSVMTIFMVNGAIIGVIGTLLGVAAGVALAVNIETVVPWMERALGVTLWDKSIYYISSLPSEVKSADVTVITVVALLLSFFATLYPAYRASRVNPAEALRYE